MTSSISSRSRSHTTTSTSSSSSSSSSEPFWISMLSRVFGSNSKGNGVNNKNSHSQTRGEREKEKERMAKKRNHNAMDNNNNNNSSHSGNSHSYQNGNNNPNNNNSSHPSSSSPSSSPATSNSSNSSRGSSLSHNPSQTQTSSSSSSSTSHPHVMKKQKLQTIFENETLRGSKGVSRPSPSPSSPSSASSSSRVDDENYMIDTPKSHNNHSYNKSNKSHGVSHSVPRSNQNKSPNNNNRNHNNNNNNNHHDDEEDDNDNENENDNGDEKSQSPPSSPSPSPSSSNSSSPSSSFSLSSSSSSSHSSPSSPLSPSRRGRPKSPHNSNSPHTPLPVATPIPNYKQLKQKGLGGTIQLAPGTALSAGGNKILTLTAAGKRRGRPASKPTSLLSLSSSPFLSPPSTPTSISQISFTPPPPPNLPNFTLPPNSLPSPMDICHGWRHDETREHDELLSPSPLPHLISPDLFISAAKTKTQPSALRHLTRQTKWSQKANQKQYAHLPNKLYQQAIATPFPSPKEVNKLLSDFLTKRILPLPSCSSLKNSYRSLQSHYPQWHESIKRPLNLMDVSSRCDHVYYWNIEEFLTDMKLVFDNASMVIPHRQNTKSHPISPSFLKIQQCRNEFFTQLYHSKSLLKLIRDPIFFALFLKRQNVFQAKFIMIPKMESKEFREMRSNIPHSIMRKLARRKGKIPTEWTNGGMDDEWWKNITNFTKEVYKKQFKSEEEEETKEGEGDDEEEEEDEDDDEEDEDDENEYDEEDLEGSEEEDEEGEDDEDDKSSEYESEEEEDEEEEEEDEEGDEDEEKEGSGEYDE